MSVLETMIQGLFPAGVVAVESRAEGNIADLSSREAACLGRAVPKRAREFAAGRFCARQALRYLGIEDWDLLVRPDRVPVWPDAVVGSISHTEGLCSAVVGNRLSFCAIGLDVETDRRVGRELYDQFLTPIENERLSGLVETEADRMATLIFSAKEAFYKCQYPVTAEWLEFADIEVSISIGGALEVRPNRDLQIETLFPAPWHGRFVVSDGWVAVGFVLPAKAGGKE